LQDRSQMQPAVVQRGIQLDGAAQVLLGRRGAGFLQQFPVGQMRARVVWLESQEPLVSRAGLRGALQGVERLGQIEVGRSMVGLFLQEGPQVPFGLLRLLLLDEQNAEVEMHHKKPRLSRQNVLVMDDRICLASGEAVGVGQVEFCAVIVRLLSQVGFERPRRPRVVLLLQGLIGLLKKLLGSLRRGRSGRKQSPARCRRESKKKQAMPKRWKRRENGSAEADPHVPCPSRNRRSAS